MKSLRFFSLIKASILKGKIRCIIFSLFITLCVICILTTVSIIIPMWSQMEYKVNNNPYNREIIVVSPKNSKIPTSDIKKLDHIVKVTEMPKEIEVINTDGSIGNTTTISYFHNNYKPVITYGRMLIENNKNEVVLPEKMYSINPITQTRGDIDCKTLVGKEIALIDNFNNNYTLSVVGTYAITDPTLNTKNIFTTSTQLFEYNKNIPNDTMDDTYYSILIDNYKYKEIVLEECSKKYIAYTNNAFNIDIEFLNTTLIILLIILVVFIAFVIIGTSAFLSNHIKNRTREMALYCSLGYKPTHIFSIIYSEYLTIFIVSFMFATISSYILSEILVNPYLKNLMQSSFISIQVQISLPYILSVFIIFLVIITILCINTTRRTSKINLSILLKER